MPTNHSLKGTEDHPGGFDSLESQILDALLELEPSHVSVPNPFHPWILLETIAPFETTPHFLASTSGSRVEKSRFHRRFELVNPPYPLVMTNIAIENGDL